MRSFAIALGVVGLLACEHGKGGPLDGNSSSEGGIIIIDGSGGQFVDDLTTNDQIELCNNFIVNICSNPTDPSIVTFCSNTCITSTSGGSGFTACTNASESLGIDTECANITVAAVQDCFLSGSASICTQGGGCMFDALEAVCP